MSYVLVLFQVFRIIYICKINGSCEILCSSCCDNKQNGFLEYDAVYSGRKVQHMRGRSLFCFVQIHSRFVVLLGAVRLHTCYIPEGNNLINFSAFFINSKFIILLNLQQI